MIDILHHPSGPAFLGYFAGWLAGTLVVSRMLRGLLIPDRSGEPDSRALRVLEEPYFAAVLRSGEDEAEHCAAVALDRRGVLELGEGSVKVKVAAPRSGLHPLEAAVLKGAASADAPYEIADETSSGFVKAAEEKLRSVGLLAGGELAGADRLYQWAVMAVVFAPGAYRLVRGLSLGRPVTFLVILLALGALTFLGVLCPRRVTRAGERALGLLKERYAFLDRAESRGMKLDPADVALAVGLFGLGAGSLGARNFVSMFTPPQSSSSSGCGSSCGGGCGGGGCGG